MKLNPDCIRDILLSVEEVTDYSHGFSYHKNENTLSRFCDYSHEEIIYHIRQCYMSSLLCDVHFYDCGDSIGVKDLTPLGHEFLSNIRSDNVWNNTKSVANKVGSYSLDVLTKIATGILTQIINKQLGY